MFVGGHLPQEWVLCILTMALYAGICLCSVERKEGRCKGAIGVMSVMRMNSISFEFC